MARQRMDTNEHLGLPLYCVYMLCLCVCVFVFSHWVVVSILV